MRASELRRSIFRRVEEERITHGVLRIRCVALERLGGRRRTISPDTQANRYLSRLALFDLAVVAGAEDRSPRGRRNSPAPREACARKSADRAASAAGGVEDAR